MNDPSPVPATSPDATDCAEFSRKNTTPDAELTAAIETIRAGQAKLTARGYTLAAALIEEALESVRDRNPDG